MAWNLQLEVRTIKLVTRSMKHFPLIILSLCVISLAISSCCGRCKGHDAEYERYLDSLATFTNSDTFKISVPVPRAKTNLDDYTPEAIGNHALQNADDYSKGRKEDGMRGWDPETEYDDDAGMQHMMEEYYESDRRQWLPE